MFPLQPNNGTLDLGDVPISSSNYICPTMWDNFILQEDLLIEGDHGRFVGDRVNLTTGSTESQRPAVSSLSRVQEKNATEIDNNTRKVMRRDIERQRRNEMSKLYESLRSLLPLEYTRGRRSVSDHMEEAVNYIKRKQNNVQRLQARKDKLKKLPDLGHSNGSSSSQVQENSPNFVAVTPCTGGVEILISTAGSEDDQGPPLSRILRELLDNGFNVVSCVSSTIADKRNTLHRIQYEASNITLEDLSGLQDRLSCMINSRHS